MKPSCDESLPDIAAARIEAALDKLRDEMHPLENIVQAFQSIFIEKSRLKAELSCQPELLAQQPDRSRFEQGVPLLMQAEVAALPEDWWHRSTERLLPALQQGFPKLREDLLAIEQALASMKLSPEQALKAAAENGIDDVARTLSDLGIRPQPWQFVLGQIMKPLLEKRSEALAPLIQELPWHKGYCPICGSMPELAFLKGTQGQRWLRCALCGHHWRFLRLTCPFCENENPEKLMVYFIVGREHERAEVCHECNRYVVCIDLRGGFDEAILEVAALGLVHLDVLSQEKGFSPAAVCAWNIVRGEDISSMPVTTKDMVSVN